MTDSAEATPPAARLGGWLFARRGLVPVPMLLVVLAFARPGGLGWALGGALVLAGEALRLWGVAHIGPASRTRGAEVSALVLSGPYAWSRNPLYAGNLLLWAGFGAMSGRPALAAALTLAMALHLRLVVAWEEHNLGRALGAPYRDYLARVPRWWGWPGARDPRPGAWRRALRSERSTLLAILAVLVALQLRATWPGGA